MGSDTPPDDARRSQKGDDLTPATEPPRRTRRLHLVKGRWCRGGWSWSGTIRGAGRRFEGAGWSVLETPVAAGLAWYIAHTLLGHHQPFFAPTAAALSLSKNRVLRGQRALQLTGGVVLGIGIGTAVKAVTGSVPGASGAAAIAVAVMVALAAALVLGGGFLEQGVLFANQSVSSAILMIAVAGTATGTERLLDALIGAGVTFVITVILFPAAPLPLIRDAVRQVFATLRDTLTHLAELAGTGEPASPQWVLATGRRIHNDLAALQQALTSARQVASLAPRRWPDRSRVRRVGEQAAPLNLLAATVLSLAHASTTGSAAPPPQSPAGGDALGELASAFAALAEGGSAGTTQAVAHTAGARAVISSTAPTGSPHSQLIARLAETLADDTLRLTESQDPSMRGRGSGLTERFRAVCRRRWCRGRR
jgi:uncharacterized membrane protein YgaE (UPF0421/DUF939 family)